MQSRLEKIHLLCDMIAFSTVDGRLHEREYEFLKLVAHELGISKLELDELFHQELPIAMPKSEQERVHQFYRLALLMHIDGVLHEREQKAIRQIGINMGLNPSATARVLQAMEASQQIIIDPNFIRKLFREQHN